MLNKGKGELDSFFSAGFTVPKRIDLSLGRIERLLSSLGHPEKRLPPVIHIAGTNGKGSVASFCRFILESCGKSVHVYTSPHLIDRRERIRLGSASGSKCVEEATLLEALRMCRVQNGEEPITLFEVLTAAAFLLYAEHSADYLVLETGLGGRFDATNVVDKPRVTVITPISLDHVESLGSDIRSIAAEKAGILKHAVPCAVGSQQVEALQVIRARGREVKAALSVCGEQWHCYAQHGRLVYEDETELLDLSLPRLQGRYQLDNAGTAITAVRLLLDESLSIDGIEQGVRNAFWPGRLQCLTGGPLLNLLSAGREIWVDGAHNAAAGQALAYAMSDLGRNSDRPLILVVAMGAGKDAEGFLSAFRGLAAHIIGVPLPEQGNGIPAKDIANQARGLGLSSTWADSVESALEKSSFLFPESRILICGSLYLVGYVLSRNGVDLLQE